MEVNICFYPVTGVVIRTQKVQKVCVLSYLSLQKKIQHQLILHLIASQLSKMILILFIVHYSITNYNSLLNILNILNKLLITINPV